MENEGAKRFKTFLKIVGVLLAIGAVCFIAVKLYKKFFKKEEPVLEGAADEVDAIGEGAVEEAAAEEVATEEDSFEVPAAAVIANADQMEA